VQSVEKLWSFSLLYFLQSLVPNTLSDSIVSSAPSSHTFCSFFSVGGKVTRIFKRICKINYIYFKLYVLYGRQTLSRCTIFVTKLYGYKQGNKFNISYYIPNFSSSSSPLSSPPYFSPFCCSLFKKLNECVLLKQALQVCKNLTFPPYLFMLFFCF